MTGLDIDLSNILFSGAVIGLAILALVWGDIRRTLSGRRIEIGKKEFTDSSAILNRLSKLVTSSSEEQENIIGDLLEEFNEFPSRLSAYLWLSKQVIKSLLPLVYKTIKARLAARFGERIR